MEAQLQERLAVAESHLGELQRDLQARFGALEQRIGDDSREAAGERGRLQRLEAELTARPYMAVPGALETADEDGNPQIGYRGTGETRDGYLGFEDLFRGSEEFIRERQRPYVDLLRGHDPVFDLGCGRGELLDLLAEAEIEAFGTDIDAGMAARAREKGHRVEQEDGLELLERTEDGVLGTVFSAQVVEHLAHEDLLRLLRLARQKLRPGGLFVAETVNPHSLQAMKTFWIDPTHEHPVFPETLVALCRAEGYDSALVIFPTGTGSLEDDVRLAGEYAVVATTAGA